MIKGKDGKWYPTKAKMLEAEQKVTDFEKRMHQISTIISMKEENKDVEEIGTKLGVAKSYVEDVLQKGCEQMEIELRSMFDLNVNPSQRIIKLNSFKKSGKWCDEFDMPLPYDIKEWDIPKFIKTHDPYPGSNFVYCGCYVNGAPFLVESKVKKKKTDKEKKEKKNLYGR